jgi:non-specific protein-tyrosine kinase
LDIRGFLKNIIRKKITVGLTLLVAIAIAALGSRLMTPVYSATAVLRIAQAQTGSLQYSDYMYVDRLVNTYARIAVSRDVLTKVAQKLNLSTKPADLAKQIQVKPIQDTELIGISTESTDPDQAVALAKTLAELIIEENNRLYLGGEKSAYEIVGDQLQTVNKSLTEKRTQLQTLQAQTDASKDTISSLTQEITGLEQSYNALLQQYESLRTNEAIRNNSVSMVESPTLPEKPVRPNWMLNIILAAFLGLIGGIGLAVGENAVDGTVREASQVSREVDLPVLGAVPHVSEAKGHRSLVALETGQLTPVSEAYRFIRANLQAMGLADSLKTIVVTSAESGDGKSTLVANLAVSIARSGLRVAVVDCDLWHPTQHKLFGNLEGPGLCDWLHEKTQLAKILQPTSVPTLRVITTGQVDDAPSETLTDARIAQLITSLRLAADVVLFDTPPVLQIADVVTLSPMVDGVLLVVGQGHVLTDQVRGAVEQIRLVKGNLLGLVMNMTDLGTRNYRYYRDAQARQKQA